MIEISSSWGELILLILVHHNFVGIAAARRKISVFLFLNYPPHHFPCNVDLPLGVVVAEPVGVDDLGLLGALDGLRVGHEAQAEHLVQREAVGRVRDVAGKEGEGRKSLE